MQSKKCLEQRWRWQAALSEVMKQAGYNAFLLKGCSEHKQTYIKFKERLSWQNNI